LVNAIAFSACGLAYEEAYQQQASLGKLMHTERAFRCATNMLQELGFDPFIKRNMRLAAKQVASIADLRLKQVERIVYAAAHCRSALKACHATTGLPGGQGRVR